MPPHRTYLSVAYPIPFSGIIREISGESSRGIDFLYNSLYLPYYQQLLLLNGAVICLYPAKVSGKDSDQHCSDITATCNLKPNFVHCHEGAEFHLEVMEHPQHTLQYHGGLRAVPSASLGVHP
jgi:hypothetical protein